MPIYRQTKKYRLFGNLRENKIVMTDRKNEVNLVTHNCDEPTMRTAGKEAKALTAKEFNAMAAYCFFAAAQEKLQ